VIFYSSIIVVLYAYLGYPLLLMLLSAVRNRPVQKATITPPVSFVIADHNEQKHIRHKMENTLRQIYPREAFEIIVDSDWSAPPTDALGRGFDERVNH